MGKGLKLKLRKFRGLTFTLVEVTGENLVGEGGIFSPPSWIGLSSEKRKTNPISNVILFKYKFISYILRLNKAFTIA